MLIELDEPFRSKWKKGYIFFRPGERKYVILVNSKSDRTSVSYARYLMGIKLGYFVPDEYEVDHIDNDKTNDNLDNLQLLTRKENIKKQHENYVPVKKNYIMLACSHCGNIFPVIDYALKYRKVDSICCSRSCSTSYYNKLHENRGLAALSQEKINTIKELMNKILIIHKFLN